ncbi:hypothetical protein ACFYXH_35850 [Streptomyces sp. NPDC002730]|uniref:hypothetical protein n=1 Tax=Streptomyces sp. NPDC002730 TaxID=3364662 RepID=UPI00368A00CC
MAWPALRRDDGSVLLRLQNDTPSGDLSPGRTSEKTPARWRPSAPDTLTTRARSHPYE